MTPSDVITYLSPHARARTGIQVIPFQRHFASPVICYWMVARGLLTRLRINRGRITCGSAEGSSNSPGVRRRILDLHLHQREPHWAAQKLTNQHDASPHPRSLEAARGQRTVAANPAAVHLRDPYEVTTGPFSKRRSGHTARRPFLFEYFGNRETRLDLHFTPPAGARCRPQMRAEVHRYG